MRGALLTITALAAVSGLAHADEKVRIAVMDFTAKGGVEQSQRDVLTDVAANEIRGTRLYDVVSKADIQAMLSLEEQKQFAGCDEASCLAEIGGALGVDYLVTSNVARFGEILALNLKLINTRESRVEHSIFHKISGGETALLDDLPTAIRELLGLSGGAAQGGANPRVLSTQAVSYGAIERELELLGYDPEQRARLKARGLLAEFDLPRVCRKLSERGFAPDEVMHLLLEQSLLSKPLEERLRWAVFYASGLDLRRWRHYTRSRLTLTEYFNDAQESSALEVMQWILLGLGGGFVIGGGTAWDSATADRARQDEEQPDATPAIAVTAVGAAMLVTYVVLLAIDLLDRGQVPERFFEKATWQEIRERLPSTTQRFPPAPRASLQSWGARDAGGLLLSLNF